MALMANMRMKMVVVVALTAVICGCGGVRNEEKGSATDTVITTTSSGVNESSSVATPAPTAASVTSSTALQSSTQCGTLADLSLGVDQSGFLTFETRATNPFDVSRSILAQVKSVIQQIATQSPACGEEVGTYTGQTDLCSELVSRLHRIQICKGENRLSIAVNQNAEILRAPVPELDVDTAVTILALAATRNKAEARRVLDRATWGRSIADARCGAALPQTAMAVDRTFAAVAHIYLFMC